MKFKKTLFLLILLVFLALSAYLLERPKNTAQPLALFPEFTTDAATLITIHNKGEDVILVKADKDWKIEDKKGFPVDSELVKKALDSITELKKTTNLVSKNPENQQLFEVDPNQGIEVKVSDAQKKLLAHFLVGKTGPDFMSTYLRKAGSHEVLLCEGYHLRSIFSRTTKNWYDVNVCKFTPEKISKITIESADKKLTLKKDHDTWQLIDPNRQSGSLQAPAKKNLADDIANTLSRLRAIDLAKEETDKSAEYELSPPARQITIALNDGTEKKISIGKKNDRNEYYVKTDQEVIYLVAQYNVDKLNKTFEELKEIPAPTDIEEPKSDQSHSKEAGSPPPEPGKNASDSEVKPRAIMPPSAPAPSMPPMPPNKQGK